MLGDDCVRGKGWRCGFVEKVNKDNVCYAAERSSMRMARLEARYMRPWVRMNRGKG